MYIFMISRGALGSRGSPGTENMVNYATHYTKTKERKKERKKERMNQ
jgi:hypothetical protein